ncbi:hypothetical protein WR25_06700 [Diploscapter pachys]|uniref:Uncharacterized protein n=1 Tax=Diploscapter pachys TaxID=2018661 RepID=A0A2A2K0S3_9BILA|nr:hypothetical protein WR25_06700 [Diploscapter pachys]
MPLCHFANRHGRVPNHLPLQSLQAESRRGRNENRNSESKRLASGQIGTEKRLTHKRNRKYDGKKKRHRHCRAQNYESRHIKKMDPNHFYNIILLM